MANSKAPSGSANAVAVIKLDNPPVNALSHAVRKHLVEELKKAEQDPAVAAVVLIGTDEFTEQWAWFFGDLFQNQKDNAYWWMKQWLKVDRPYNETFAEIVTGAWNATPVQWKVAKV